MNCKGVEAAMAEAKRFLVRAKEYVATTEHCRLHDGSGSYEAPRKNESGAVRRASLDLTRALADMRKP